jgi:hypothetical protein
MLRKTPTGAQQQGFSAGYGDQTLSLAFLFMAMPF